MEGAGGCGMSDLNFTKGSLDIPTQRGILSIAIPVFSSIIVPNECLCPRRVTTKFSTSNVDDVKSFHVGLETGEYIQRKREKLKREHVCRKKARVCTGRVWN